MNRTPLLVAAVALLLLPVAAAAQPVPVQARVQATATGTATGVLDFGELLPGAAAKTVALDGTTGGGTTVGILEIAHTGNFSVTGAASTVTLTRTGGTETLNASLLCDLVSTTNATPAGAVCTSTFTHSTGGTATMYLRVGGTLDAIDPAQTSGDYAGTISLTISVL